LGLSVFALPVSAADAPVAEVADVETEPGASSDGLRSIEGHWLPTLTLGMGFLISGLDARAYSTGNSADSVEMSVQRKETVVSPQFLVALGLETPELTSGLRVFASGGVVPTIAFSRDIAKIRDPRGFDYPVQRDLGEPYPEEAIGGTGIRTTAKIDPLAFTANFGVSYTRELLERQIVFRPSLGWYRYTINTEGVSLRAIKPDTNNPFVREITLTDERSRTFDALGPVIEIGVDLGQKGRFKPTMFLEAGFYYNLTDTRIELEDALSQAVEPSAEFPNPVGTEVAHWRLDVDQWSTRVTLGIRVAWIGW
jgi:hypothetical protein